MKCSPVSRLPNMDALLSVACAPNTRTLSAWCLPVVIHPKQLLLEQALLQDGGINKLRPSMHNIGLPSEGCPNSKQQYHASTSKHQDCGSPRYCRTSAAPSRRSRGSTKTAKRHGESSPSQQQLRLKMHALGIPAISNSGLLSRRLRTCQHLPNFSCMQKPALGVGSGSARDQNGHQPTPAAPHQKSTAKHGRTTILVLSRKADINLYTASPCFCISNRLLISVKRSGLLALELLDPLYSSIKFARPLRVLCSSLETTRVLASGLRLLFLQTLQSCLKLFHHICFFSNALLLHFLAHFPTVSLAFESFLHPFRPVCNLLKLLLGAFRLGLLVLSKSGFCISVPFERFAYL